MPSNPNAYRVIGDAFRQPVTVRSRKPRRLVFFLSVFLPFLLASQIYVFTQPAIYASEASLLTTAATDLDQTSADPDLQHVNIQKQLLLGQAILEKTAEQLKTGSLKLSANDLSGMFAVSPIQGTNLLKLRAEGSEPHVLQMAVNFWIDAYSQSRAEYITENSDKVQQSLNDELARIDRQIENKRQELDTFRREHDILSVESADNVAHARLQGLNESLNEVMAEEIKAKSKIDAIHNALAQHKNVVPEADTEAIALLTQQAELLRERLQGLRAQYTDQYIQFNPTLRKIPTELAELEDKIAGKINNGKSVAIQEAENNYAAAHQAVLATQNQLDQHKKIVADYTSQFAKHQALQKELEAMETLKQETKQRLVDIDVKQRQKYPQVEIIDTASLPDKPIRPDYWMESAIAFAASLTIGLLAIWLIEFLHRENQTPAMETVSITPLSFTSQQTLADYGAATDQITYSSRKVLEIEAKPRELSRQEIATLFGSADRPSKIILALLLNGLSAEEILSLTTDCFDLASKILTIPLSARQLAMTQCTEALLTAATWKPAEVSVEEFDALLTCSAIDAGLSEPEQINTNTISYSYTLFLIRQGIKLTDLAKIIGPISPSRLMSLGKFSPDSPGLPLERINRDYLKNCQAGLF